MATIEFTVAFGSSEAQTALAALCGATRCGNKGSNDPIYQPSPAWIDRIKAAYPGVKVSDATGRLTGVKAAENIVNMVRLAVSQGKDLSSVTLPLANGGSVGARRLIDALDGKRESYIGG